MILGKKIIVVMPAYNASSTIEKTYNEIPFDIVDDVILTDDNSFDNTTDIAHKLGIKHILIHDKNRGYGANQKTCYNKALELGADIIIMLHPDYQYNPKLIHSIAYLIAHNVYAVVLGSRILGGTALEGGMPLLKYIANRMLTLFQNIILNNKISEYHTGYRGYSAEVLNQVNYNNNSDGFVFDNQILLQVISRKFRIGEISCPTRYMKDSSSISYYNSLIYALGVIGNTFLYVLNNYNVYKHKIYR